MAKTYKQRIYADLDALMDKYPNAKASDMVQMLEATVTAIWHSLPKPKEKRKLSERTARYRIV